MDATDEADGNIPAEYYALWKQYQALQTDAEKEAFILQYPDLARDFRAEYRQKNPEADAMLALWGYGGKLQTMDAYNLVVKWSKELGIPLEQMGLGLPPQSLIKDYFDYNQLSGQFGGNSAEAKLFRLTHPAWNTWGLEQGTWSDDLSGESSEALQISVLWREQDKAYDALTNSAEREAFLTNNVEYARARRQRDAFNIGFPAQLIDNYVSWYTDSSLKKPSDWKYDLFFEDDWFLMEHQEFYEAGIEFLGWEPRNFTKVPTREVFSLYQTYSNLPKGRDRLDFRAKHPDLDAWLLLTGKVSKPVGERGDEEAEKTPWEKAAEAEGTAEAIENLKF